MATGLDCTDVEDDSHQERLYESRCLLLDMLVDIVGEDEDHEFARIMDALGDAVKQYEDRVYPIN